MQCTGMRSGWRARMRADSRQRRSAAETEQFASQPSNRCSKHTNTPTPETNELVQT